MPSDSSEKFNRTIHAIGRSWADLEPSKIGEHVNPLRFLPLQNWHEAEWMGHWDHKRILSEYKHALIYSYAHNEMWDIKEPGLQLETAIFKLNDALYFGIGKIVDCGGHCDVPLRVWASDMDLASSTIENLRGRFLLPRKRTRERPRFNIFSIGSDGIDRRSIEIRKPLVKSDADLALHYGADFPEWQAKFIRTLKAQRSGVSILRGDPGTGKTSFIRHLISKTSATHRFYYLPLRHYRMLSDPAMVDFWIRESGKTGFEKLRKIVVLEDAESLIIERGADNRDDLSNLLNMSDGLLGEFLQVQVICTINCPIDKLDTAVTRPGRLLGFRSFRRLCRQEAEALATAKGLTLRPQADYSLAEIYHGAGLKAWPEPERKHLGFSVS